MCKIQLTFLQLVDGFSSPDPEDYKYVTLLPEQLLPQALFAQLLRGLQGFLRPLSGEQR